MGNLGGHQRVCDRKKKTTVCAALCTYMKSICTAGPSYSVPAGLSSNQKRKNNNNNEFILLTCVSCMSHSQTQLLLLCQRLHQKHVNETHSHTVCHYQEHELASSQTLLCKYSAVCTLNLKHIAKLQTGVGVGGVYLPTCLNFVHFPVYHGWKWSPVNVT